MPNCAMLYTYELLYRCAVLCCTCVNECKMTTTKRRRRKEASEVVTHPTQALSFRTADDRGPAATAAAKARAARSASSDPLPVPPPPPPATTAATVLLPSLSIATADGVNEKKTQ